MIFFSYLKTLFFVTALFVPLIACASQPGSPARMYHDIKTEISLKAWDTKGSGPVIANEVISFIYTDNRYGDIVILRWSADKTHFKAEVYEPEQTETQPIMWTLKSDGASKTLTAQFDNDYIISERVDAGIQVEYFKLR